MLTITDLGRTIGDGQAATVRFVTADGAVTTVVLRAPRAPPDTGSVSLLRASPGGNPGSGGGGGSSLTLQWSSATVDWHQDSCCLDSDYEPHDVVVGDSDRGHFAYETYLRTEETDGTNVYDSSDIETDGHDIDLHGDVLYAATSGGIEAFAESDGTEQWTTTQTELGMSTVNALSISAGGTIYAAGDDLAALDTSGSVQWTDTVSPDNIADVEHLDGSLYVAAVSESKLYKFDTSDRSVDWSIALGSSPESVAVRDGSVFVTWGDTVSAVYPTNGTRIWSVAVDDAAIDHLGVGGNGSVYASATGGLTIYRIEQSA